MSCGQEQVKHQENNSHGSTTILIGIRLMCYKNNIKSPEVNELAKYFL